MANRTPDSVRDRVSQGKNVRPGPLADAAGVARATLHAWINEGKLEAIRFERTVMIPPHAAARLLGMGSLAPQQKVAA